MVPIEYRPDDDRPAQLREAAARIRTEARLRAEVRDGLAAEAARSVTPLTDDDVAAVQRRPGPGRAARLRIWSASRLLIG